MRSRAAQVEAVHRRAVACPAGQGPHEEELIQAQVTVEDIALGQAVDALEVERGQDLAGDHRGRDVRCVLADLSDHEVA